MKLTRLTAGGIKVIERVLTKPVLEAGFFAAVDGVPARRREQPEHRCKGNYESKAVSSENQLPQHYQVWIICGSDAIRNAVELRDDP